MSYCSIIFSTVTRVLFNSMLIPSAKSINFETYSFFEDSRESTICWNVWLSKNISPRPSLLLDCPYVYMCIIIFTLNFFSFGVDINECQISNPCKNGGQCENTHGSYECKCTPGFTGRNCETGGLKFRPYTFKNRFEWYSNRWPSRFQLIAWIYGEKIAKKILQKAKELLTDLRIFLARRGTNLLVSSQGRNISGV